MTQGESKASQATTDSFPMSSPSFWQAAAEVQPEAGPSRPPKRAVRFLDDELVEKPRIATLSPTPINSALSANDFYASDDEEEAAIRRREQANKEYLMNPEYAPNKFGDIGDYMRKKDIKVQTQYRDLATEAEGSVPQIFKGYVFHINGNVNPPLEILRKLILHRGGVILPVLRRKTSVTHIIAPVLPPSKHVAFADYKVVKPAWIVASVEANQVLDWRRWKLVPTGGELESAQKGMDRFLAKGSPQSASARSPKAKDEASIPITTLPIPPRPPDPILPGNDSISVYDEDLVRPATPVKQMRDVVDNLVVPNDVDPAPTEASATQRDSPATPSKSSNSAIVAKLQSPLPDGTRQLAEGKGNEVSPARAKQPYKNPWKNYFKFEQNPDAQRLMKDDAWQQKHTAQAGNDFIDGYYQNSRLHHLSTWKAELKVLVSAAQREAETAPRPQLPASTADTLSLSTSVLPRVGSPARVNLSKAEGRVIMHVDFDAFFVSCGLALRPDLKGKPTVVCHSQGRQGTLGSTSEIASCSYEARAKGVKNGMSLGRARDLCPGIVTLPYEFDTYKKFSIAFYTILMGYADDLEAVSVDEALIDATGAVKSLRLAPEEDEEMPLHIHRAYEADDVFSASPGNQGNLDSIKPRDWAVMVAQKIRDDVRAATGCEVSIGISHNVLLAKLATRHAKPAGVHHLLPSAIPAFISPLDVDDFPSFGYSMKRKIQERLGTTNCGELLKQSKQTLKEVCGPKNGETLYGFLRGEDERQLEAHKERKSVSAEVNYGIRFVNQQQAEEFLVNLSGEVSNRLKRLHTKGKILTLKVMSRHPDAPVEAPKFMGHGVCETFNKSASISDSKGAATDNADAISAESIKLLRAMKIDPVELRGLGMQVVKLEVEGTTLAQADRPKDQPALDLRAFKQPKKVLAPDDNFETHSDMILSSVAHSSDRIAPAAVNLEQHPPTSEALTARATADEEGGPDIDQSFLDAMPPSLRQEVEREITRRGARSASRAMSEVPSVPTAQPKAPVRATTKSPANRKASERNSAAHITKQLRPNIKSFLPTKVLAEQPLFKARRKRSITPIQEDDVIDLTNTPSKRPRLDQPKIGAYRVDRLEWLGLDLEWFSALPPDMQDEQVNDREAEVRGQSSRSAGFGAWKVKQESEQRRSFSASVSPTKDRARSTSVGPVAPPIAIKRIVKPTLSKKQSTSDVLDVISSWVGAGIKKGPEEKDAARVMKYLGKCLDDSQAGQAGLGDACTVLGWWKSLLLESWPEREGEVGKKWWAAWDKAALVCNEESLRRFRAPMKL